MTVWMCARCGCTAWYEDHYTSGTVRYHSSLDEGEEFETEGLDDDEESGDIGDPRCNECDSDDLLEVDELEDDQIQYLRDCITRETRVEAHEKFSSGETVDSMKKSDSPRKGRLIGGKPIQ